MNKSRNLVALLGLLSLLLWGCNKPADSGGRADPKAPHLKLAVFLDGRVTVDGTATTIERLSEALHQLNEQHGVVWYYRESPHNEKPPEIAKEVVKIIAKERLPIRLSSLPDYSDEIGPDGKPMAQ